MNTRTLQTNLMLLGYGGFLGKDGIDGILGNDSKKTVKKFQSDYNKKFNKKILIDGIPGKQTYKAINHWLKNVGSKGTRNFSVNEFRCKGSGTLIKLDNKLLTGLEKLRYHFGGKAVIINSGYRSPSHNRKVGGASNSQHLYGKAADIVVRGIKPSSVYNQAVKIFDGVGKYPTFTHVDTRGYKARF